MYFQSELMKVPQMKLINHIGQATQLPPVQSLRGAKTLYHFLLRHKETFESRMTLHSPITVLNSHAQQVLRTLPMLGIGRHSWYAIL